MTDIVDEQTRSRMMSRIRGKNTKPELPLRRALHARSFRFRLHSGEVHGRPEQWRFESLDCHIEPPRTSLLTLMLSNS